MARNPFEERRQDLQFQPYDPAETTRQLGFIASYGQPDFRPRGGGESTPLSEAVADLFGNPEAAAQQKLLGNEMAQQRALQKGPVIPGKGSPRPKEVVQGFQKDGFTIKNIRSAIKALAGAPYEMGIRQGDQATQNAIADASVPQMPVDEQMLSLAAKNPEIAKQLDRTMGTGRTQRVEYQRRQIENEALREQAMLKEYANPYNSPEGAEVYLRSGAEAGIGEDVANHPKAKKLLATETGRAGVLDYLPVLAQVGPENIRPAVMGDRTTSYYLPGQVFDKAGNPKGIPATAGQFGRALVEGGVVNDIKGRKWIAGLSGGELDDLRSEAKTILAGGDVENLDDDKERKLYEESLLAMDSLVTGADPGYRVSPEAMSRASRAYELMLKEGGEMLHFQQADGEGRIGVTSEKLKDEMLGRREIDSGFWNGQETLAEQLNLTPGEREDLVSILEDVAKKKLGTIDLKIRKVLEQDLVNRGYDEPVERMAILDGAMPAVRQSLIAQNARKLAEKDFAKFVARSVLPVWKNYKPNGMPLKDDSKLSKEGKKIAKAQDARAESDALQQMFAAQQGGGTGGMDQGMGMPGEVPDWLLEEEMAREKFAYPGPQQIDGGQRLGGVSPAQMTSNIRAKKKQRKGE